MGCWWRKQSVWARVGAAGTEAAARAPSAGAQMARVTQVAEGSSKPAGMLRDATPMQESVRSR